ncbi:hypothetical protein BC332_25242 [Capsicum chinense]|nr:hypothetical protein BC332_25242 [Capsicum chinense]
MATITARSLLRSATTSSRTAAIRLSGSSMPKASPSPFRMPSQKPLTARIFRSPVEMSCVRVETMFPHYTATASALLNSMLSATPRSYGWSLEVLADYIMLSRFILMYFVFNQIYDECQNVQAKFNHAVLMTKRVSGRRVR